MQYFLPAPDYKDCLHKHKVTFSLCNNNLMQPSVLPLHVVSPPETIAQGEAWVLFLGITNIQCPKILN